MNESDKDTGKLTPFFILGLSSIAAQVIYLREILSVFYGTEFAIALVLGAWLLWTGIGAIASAFVSRFLTANIFILFALGLSIALPIDLWIIRNLRGYFDAPAGEYLSLSNLVVSILITTSLPCALFGAIFTTGTKIIRRFSSIYIIETAGCFVGGLALSLFLIQIINPFAILALCSLLILISCATSLYNLINRLLRLISILTAITLTAILIGSDRIDFASHKKFWRNFHPEFSFAEGTDSRYGYISVISYQGEYTIYQNGHKLYSLSKEEEQIPLAHLVMLQAVQPNDILLIGGGISGALREILKHEIKKIDYIELDPIL
ncbi:MAG: hypothetical protein HY606_07450, partial [Planctomycetes bacterium]|nr:hypothetical protein [Planctomycetota bacterium]